MARVRNWSHGYTVALIWFLSFLLFMLGFQLALRNSVSSQKDRSMESVPPTSNSERRSILYNKMEHDLDEHGAVFLRGGETSQSLSLSDIFSLRDGIVTPVPKAANPPVRANVLYLSPEFSVPISQAVGDIFLPYFDKAIWFQNSSLYHFSMFHASHHIEAVPATENEIEAEANAVKAVVETLCPLKIVLDRVVLTSTGVLLGCWQIPLRNLRVVSDAIASGLTTYVTSGTDPIEVRAKLRKALPRAPEKQLYDPSMLHTSFARLLGPPKIPSEEKLKHSDQLQLFHELVMHLDNQIRGIEAVVSELWYVEEFDVLALALNGRMKARKFNFGCSRT